MLKRALLGVVGVLLILAGTVLGSLAGWGYLTFANGGSLRFDLGTVVPGTSDTAIVLDVARFGASIPYLDAIGETQLAAHSAQPDGAGTPLFVGAASTSDADAYVRGTPYAVGLRDATGWQVRQIPGAQPLPAATATPWLAQATGPTALVDVPTTRPLTVVVTRTDGAPVGAVALAADFAVPTAQTWALWAGVAALVLLIVGVVLLVLAFRRRRRPRGAHEAGAAEAVVTETVTAEPAVVTEVAAVETAAAEPVVVTETVTAEPVVAEPAATEPAAEAVAPAAEAPQETESIEVVAARADIDATAEIPVAAATEPADAAEAVAAVARPAVAVEPPAESAAPEPPADEHQAT